MHKKSFYTELAYILGILTLALGTAFMERADFGMSMVVAPAYILHLKISQALPFFSFGMAEYCLQAVLLAIIALVLRRFKPMYLFSFATAVIYGFTLDGCIALTAGLPGSGMIARFVFFFAGLLLCSVGVALHFHTYIAPEAYELLVKEIAGEKRFPIGTVKTVYDCTSCALSVLLSFVFFGFGHFEGVKLGTVFCALVNGFIIAKISQVLESRFDFRDGLRKETHGIR